GPPRPRSAASPRLRPRRPPAPRRTPSRCAPPRWRPRRAQRGGPPLVAPPPVDEMRRQRRRVVAPSLRTDDGLDALEHVAAHWLTPRKHEFVHDLHPNATCRGATAFPAARLDLPASGPLCDGIFLPH